MGFAETFQALSDPMRREILLLLRGGRMTAGELAGHFGQSPAAMSYHLSKLKKAELVTEFKQKNFIYYELNVSVLEELLLWIKQFSDKEGTDKEGQS